MVEEYKLRHFCVGCLESFASDWECKVHSEKCLKFLEVKHEMLEQFYPAIPRENNKLKLRISNLDLSEYQEIRDNDMLQAEAKVLKFDDYNEEIDVTFKSLGGLVSTVKFLCENYDSPEFEVI